MKAITWTKYGPPNVLRLSEVAKPAPKDDQVLIRIVAATVTAGDTEMRNLKFPFYLSFLMRLFVGLIKPSRITILGMELAGEIEAVGKAVTRFKVGDQIFGTTGFGFGAYAEYICLPAESSDMAAVLAVKPANISFAEAAAVPTGGLEALHFLKKADIRDSQKVLIYGSGGSIGTFAVQLAKHFGAEVTSVDSAPKLDMLRSIGADHVIDYTTTDFTDNGISYDVIFDVVGKSSFSGSINSLTKNGRYLIANPKLSYLLRSVLISMTSSKKVIIGAANQKLEHLLFLRELIEAGVLKSVIDRSYPLEQIVEAHRYVETGRKKGNVVIALEHNNNI